MDLQREVEASVGNANSERFAAMRGEIRRLMADGTSSSLFVLRNAEQQALDLLAWDALAILLDEGLSPAHSHRFIRTVVGAGRFDLLLTAVSQPNNAEIEEAILAIADSGDVLLLKTVLRHVAEQLPLATLRKLVHLALAKRDYDALVASVTEISAILHDDSLNEFLARTGEIDDPRFPLLFLALGAENHAMPGAWRDRLGI